MHAHHHPVDVAVLLRRLERRLQEALLRAARVAAHVRVPAVLVADVIVVQADDSYRTGGEGVPEPAQLGIGIRFWQSEVRLIGGVSDRSVASFVLVVARCGHPRPMARGAAVVVEPGRPRPDPIGGEVGVAQVTVDEVEQRGDALDAGRHVTRRRRAAAVAAIGRRAPCDVQCRRRLIAEAGEGDPVATLRGRAEGAQFGRCAVVHCGVHVVRVRRQPRQPSVIYPNFAAGLGISINLGVGHGGRPEPRCRGSEQDARIADRFGRVPGRYEFGRRVGAELQMQSRHGRCTARIGSAPRIDAAVRSRTHQRERTGTERCAADR